MHNPANFEALSQARIHIIPAVPHKWKDLPVIWYRVRRMQKGRRVPRDVPWLAQHDSGLSLTSWNAP